MLIKSILPSLTSATGQELSNSKVSSIGGGDINAAYKLETEAVSWFIKVNRPELSHMFIAEAAALGELADTYTIKVPEVVHVDKNDDAAYLVLEYIPLTRLTANSNHLLGKRLAALHQKKQAYFGWHTDNTIGSTPQINSRSDDWADFWAQNRLGQQLKFAADNGYGGRLITMGEQLIESVPNFFSDYQPIPSLLHGDLWSGNASADRNGNPVIYDPACYYGDREADLAMTELFGGFGADFYRAYDEVFPIDPGYKTRKVLYNLYHILNHLNLFGSGYQHQAEAMIGQLLAET